MLEAEGPEKEQSEQEDTVAKTRCRETEEETLGKEASEEEKGSQKEEKRSPSQKEVNRQKTQQEQQASAKRKALRAEKAKLEEEQKKQTSELRRKEALQAEARLKVEMQQQQVQQQEKAWEQSVTNTLQNCLLRWAFDLEQRGSQQIAEFLQARCQHITACEDVARQVYAQEGFGWWLLAIHRVGAGEHVASCLTEQRTRLKQIIKQFFPHATGKTPPGEWLFSSVYDAAHAEAATRLQSSLGGR